MIDPNDVDSV